MPDKIKSTPFAERILAVMRARGCMKKTGNPNQLKFERLCGLSGSAIHNVFYTGRILEPEPIKKIASAMKINERWLADGVGEMELDESRFPGFAPGAYEAIRFSRVVGATDAAIERAVKTLSKEAAPLTVFLRCYSEHLGASVQLNISNEPTATRAETDPFREIGVIPQAIRNEGGSHL